MYNKKIRFLTSWLLVMTLLSTTNFNAQAAISEFEDGMTIGPGDVVTPSGLMLEVDGKIGGSEFCDAAGNNCTVAGDLGGFWNEGAGANEINYTAGNIGIGIGDPSRSLHVGGSGMLIDHSNANYDLWIQGGTATSGDNRNLAFIGFDEDSGDYLGINWSNEYANGVRMPTNVGIGANFAPSQELHVRNDQNSSTLVAVQNTSNGTGSDTRAGINLASNGNNLDISSYGASAGSTLAGVNRADSIFIRNSSGGPASSMNIGTGAAVPLNLFTNDDVRMTIEGTSGDVRMVGNTRLLKFGAAGEVGPYGIDFGNNEGTLVYRTTPNTIGIENSAETTFFSVDVDDAQAYFSGDVSVGTTVQRSRLNISDTINANPTVLTIENGDTTIDTNQLANSIDFYTNDASGNGTGVTGRIAQVAENAGNIYGLGFYTYNNASGLGEAMRMTRTGDVGIGDTTPDGTLKLDVEGRVGATEYCDENGANCTAAAALGSGYWSLSGTNDVFYNGGEVGIGLSNPTEELVVNRSQASPTTIAVQNTSGSANTDTRAGFTAQSNGSTSDFVVWGSNAAGSWGGQTLADATMIRNYGGAPSSKMLIGTGAAVPLYFATDGATRMTITGAGNVGIGKTNPGVALDMVGQIRTTSNIEAGNGTGGVAMTVNDGYGNANLTFNHVSGRSDITGNAARIEVNTDATSDAQMMFELGDNLASGVATALTGVMRLGADGLVGIGTNSPSEVLDIRNNAPTIRLTDNNTNADAALTANSGVGGVALQADLNSEVVGSYIDLSVDGATRLRVLENGNVGIGTTNPSSKLEVIGDIRSQLSISGNDTGIVLTNDGSQRPKLGFRVSDDSERFKIHLEDINTASERLGFTKSAGGSAEVMSIESTGMVGIGTINPNQKLHIEGGDMRINSGGNGSIRFGASDQYLYGDGDSLLYYNSDNSTTSQMIFRDKENTAYGRVYGAGNGSQFGLLDGDGSWGILMQKDDFTGFRVNDSEKMRIQTNGDIGIGTTSPRSLLSIRDTINANPTVLTIENGDTTIDNAQLVNSLDFYTNDASTNGSGVTGRIAQVAENAGNLYGLGFYSYSSGGGLSEAMRINQAGNVGIGTTAPSESLHIESATPGIRLVDTTTGADSYIAANSGVGGLAIQADGNSEVVGSYIDLSVDGATRLRVLENGNVGIGDPTPDGTLKLDVEGPVGATQYCDQNGANCTLAGDLGGGLWNEGAGANEINYTAGNVGVGTSNPIQDLDVRGEMVLNSDSASYDIWLQGGTTTSGGDARNLALLGVTSGDYLGVNWGGEYAGGTRIFGNTAIGSNFNPTEELHTRVDQANPTTVVAQNASASTNTNTRAGFTAQSNGGQLELMQYGSAATGSLGGITKADAAYLRTTSGAPSSSLNVGNGGAVPLNFFTSDVTRMTIASGGNVGIGDTNPQDRLDIGNGNIRIQGKSGNDMQLGPAQNFVSGVSIRATANPDNDSTIFGVESSGSASRFGVTQGNGAWARDGFWVGQYDDGVLPRETGMTYSGTDMRLFAGAGERMRIASGGNVGMGIANPSEALVVYKSAANNFSGIRNTTFRPHLTLEDLSTTTNDWQIWADSGDLSFLYGDASDGVSKLTNTAMVLDANNGNVGFGTAAPSEVLHINSSNPSIRMVDTNTGADSFITANSGVGGVAIQADLNSEVVGSYLDLSVDGATRLRVTESGDVGIGDTSPGEKLDVQGTILAKVIPYSSNQDGAYLIAGSNNYTGAATNWGTYGFQHRLKTNGGGSPRITVDAPAGGEVFTIENGGDVGIGDPTPDGTLKLDVNGNIGANNYCDQNGGNCVSSATLGAGDNLGNHIATLNLNVNDRQIQNVNALQFKDLDDNTGGADNKVRMFARDGAHTFYDGGVVVGRYGNGTWADVANGRLIVQDRIGVGITGPSEEIHVRSDQTNPTSIVAQNGSGGADSDVSAGFTAQSNGTALRIETYGTAATGNLAGSTRADGAFIRTSSGAPASSLNLGTGGGVPLRLFTNDANRITITGAGNVGIGENAPQQRLHVEGNIRMDGNRFYFGSGDGGDFLDYATQQGVTYHENGNPKWRLTGNGDNFINGGNVGIGTTTPGAKLDVDGVIRLNDRLEFDGVVDAGVEATRVGTTDTLFLTANDNLEFETGGTTKVIVTGGGDVGIGNSGPAAKLHVVDASGFGPTTDIMRIQGDSDSIIWRNTGQGDYSLINSQQANGINFYDGTGGVGISYNGVEVVKVDDTGGLEVMTGDLSFGNTIKTRSGTERCGAGLVMVGFDTSGLLCELPAYE